MENDLLSVLSKGGNKFSKGQRIIAKYILSNYDKAAFMTAGIDGSPICGRAGL